MQQQYYGRMPEAGGRIRILDPAVARKIAAGEVIERPSGVVRELLDNSLDAGARHVDVELAAGGNDLIHVVDDGHGMNRADLERCYLAHATSKISSDEDLLHVRTLGFRGEALSSVAAVARLEITSAQGTDTPHRLKVEGGRLVSLGPSAGAPGTSVRVSDLFYNVPARREFRKRSASEFTVAKSVFLDKALPFPEVSFRLSSNGAVRNYLHSGTLLERITAAYPERTEPARLHELDATGEGFQAHLIAGEPSFPRKDRKGLQIFVNRRRIWEYALVQAVEYAYRDYLHGGLYPIAYLFLDIDPELVDFNIHPAKREVRFRNLPAIHRRIVSTLSGYLRIFDHRAATRGASLPFAETQPTDNAAPVSRTSNATVPPPIYDTRSRQNGSFDLTRTYRPQETGTSESGVAEAPPHPALESGAFRYLGQVMDLFLVVERDDRLYLVDQHAAHERVIYDRLRAGGGGQELLFPVRLEFDDEALETVRGKRDHLRRLGIELEERDGGWELVTVPSAIAIEADALAALLMDLLDRPSDFERELYASLSCRSAVMDGDRLAHDTAVQIVAGVIGLENARCPHGRPIWVELTREQLFGMVGRT